MENGMIANKAIANDTRKRYENSVGLFFITLHILHKQTWPGKAAAHLTMSSLVLSLLFYYSKV